MFCRIARCFSGPAARAVKGRPAGVGFERVDVMKGRWNSSCHAANAGQLYDDGEELLGFSGEGRERAYWLGTTLGRIGEPITRNSVLMRRVGGRAGVGENCHQNER